MTDQQIIQALIARDNAITQDFFFTQCRPLFNSIISRVFDYEVDYDECINELYLYLLYNNGERLKQFQGRSSLFLWLKVTATRFWVKQRRRMIENTSHEPLYGWEEENNDSLAVAPSDFNGTASLDVENLLEIMPNKRYAHVLRQLLLNELSPEELAKEMHITVDNLYNIKRRALQQLMQVALSDIRHYGKHE